MKETELFVKILRNFKQDVETVSAKYQSELDWLERYKDSATYQSDRAFYEKRKEDALAGIRAAAQESIEANFKMMRLDYERKPLALPTDEEKAVLSALEMLDTLTKDDILRALNTCTSPLAVRRLQELSKKSGVHGVGFGDALRRDDISRHLQNAENAAAHFIRLYGEDKTRYVHDPIKGTDSIMLCATREGLFDSPTREVWRVFGGIQPERFEEFSAAVC